MRPELWRARLAAGTCGECGENKPERNKSRCWRCRRRHNTGSNASYHRVRKHQHQCSACGGLNHNARACEKNPSLLDTDGAIKRCERCRAPLLPREVATHLCETLTIDQFAGRRSNAYLTEAVW